MGLSREIFSRKSLKAIRKQESNFPVFSLLLCRAFKRALEGPTRWHNAMRLDVLDNVNDGKSTVCLLTPGKVDGHILAIL